MPKAAQPIDLWIGEEPPLNPTPRTRWRSTSAQYAQVPHTPFERMPIIGSYVGNASATQEHSPWYNPVLQRYECTVTTASAQYFWYADDPVNGPWQGGTQVLGGGFGGEAAAAQQCSIYVEGTQLYALYLKSPSATVVTMATATMPLTPSAVPVFTVVGTIYDNAGQTILDSCWLSKANGIYVLVAQLNGAPRLALTTASHPSQFVAQPFVANMQSLRNLSFNIGIRYVQRLGRPQLFYENGVSTMFGHIVDTTDFGGSQAYRFICRDPWPYLVNWVMDPVQRPFLEQAHPAEGDQIADLRRFQGANEQWFFSWTGADNAGTKFTIMCAAQRDPELASDGFTWQIVNNVANSGAGPGYINPDVCTQDVITGNGVPRVLHMWDAVFRTNVGNLKATFSAAFAHYKCMITNAPLDVTSGNVVHLLPDNATDRISDGNVLTSVTRAGAVVTLVFKYPTDYDPNDFLCVTGMTPTAYNTTAQAITSVSADRKTITYTLGADPGANTVIGAVARSVRTGESRGYKCRVQGIIVRNAQ